MEIITSYSGRVASTPRWGKIFPFGCESRTKPSVPVLLGPRTAVLARGRKRDDYTDPFSHQKQDEGVRGRAGEPRARAILPRWEKF